MGGYPTFRGLMTWSINWDAVSTCSNSYAFANNYTAIFGSPTFVSNLESNHSSFKFYPNPSETLLYVHFNDESINNTQLNIFNAFGQLVSKQNVTSNQLKIDISHLSKGVYFIKANNTSARFLRN